MMINKQLAARVFMFAAFCLLASAAVHGEVLERVVAIVNDDIILLSEFEITVDTARKADIMDSDEALLNEMINRLLLLKEAERLKIGKGSKKDADDNAVIKEYIDRRIKAFIHIPPDDIEYHYVWNREQFAGKEFYEVRDEIEKQLVDKVLSERLREYIKELRDGAFIRIQYER